MPHPGRLRKGFETDASEMGALGECLAETRCDHRSLYTDVGVDDFNEI